MEIQKSEKCMNKINNIDKEIDKNINQENYSDNSS